MFFCNLTDFFVTLTVALYSEDRIATIRRSGTQADGGRTGAEPSPVALKRKTCVKKDLFSQGLVQPDLFGRTCSASICSAGRPFPTEDRQHERNPKFGLYQTLAKVQRRTPVVPQCTCKLPFGPRQCKQPMRLAMVSVHSALAKLFSKKDRLTMAATPPAA